MYLKNIKSTIIELTNKKKTIKNNKVIYQDLTKKINLTIKVDAIIHCAAKILLKKMTVTSKYLFNKCEDDQKFNKICK